jgi:hypothetical protein
MVHLLVSLHQRWFRRNRLLSCSSILRLWQAILLLCGLLWSSLPPSSKKWRNRSRRCGDIGAAAALNAYLHHAPWSRIALS